MLSFTEENYLKAIYKIAERNGDQNISTKAIAEELGTTSASVTDMIKRLAEKQLISYEKYYGVNLSKEGQKLALDLVRKHRLWEVFLFEKLGFKWDEIHDVAEQLEHIKSSALVQKLDEFLDYPKFDPHGDPIPNQNGSFTFRHQTPLSNIKVKGTRVQILGVKTSEANFLKYLEEIFIYPGKELAILDYTHFDKSMILQNEALNTITLSYNVSKEILVKTI
ncbi:MAG: metal-dependent transcriptional regulator [Saprospiraceae bacterium]|nr:metal-dependent transcriptional regulator [Candidatus Vicinibacter affinis]MBP6171920.1 metal-dependent transcriptional regulator [Saprospiraceae bacterium]MBK6573088.1 metal-dependent transcriptional regulator [Candidatus Vicinibacter affinis]MBK6822449.1 metal-dependent transcriptional regulator [Candidatus Vicinibacter affinis]MBK7301769.1 metal-dependent transcriptional regulator [Candidatus Vicinibacter affinis]